TLVTPLQMALVAATVANHGALMRPHLVLEATGKSGPSIIGPTFIRQVVAPPIAAEIATAMRQAVGGEVGGIFTAGANVRGLQVAGKSGTAELDPGQRPHSWFIGFAPYDNPEVAIAVIIERPASGVRASPLAGELFWAWRTWAGG